MAETKAPEKAVETKTEVNPAQALADKAGKLLLKHVTGEVEQWDGERNDMFNLMLKNKGVDPCANGLNAMDFAEKVMETLKHSTFYVGFDLSIPQPNGRTKKVRALMISVNKENGYLQCSARRLQQARITTRVEQVVGKAKEEEVDFSGIEAGGDEDVSFDV